MGQRLPLPEALQKTASMLQRAYPGGLPEVDYLPLIALLYDHMSDRNLAEVLFNVFGVEYVVVLNDIPKVDSPEAPNPRSIDIVRAKLLPVGWDAWLKEA
jgi:hypothetical protein